MIIPMALVPAEATQAMSDALVGELLPVSEWSFQADYAAMIGASPTSGRVSRADLERAAEAHHDRRLPAGYEAFRFAKASDSTKRGLIEDMAAALLALGLSLEPGIQDEEGV